MKYLAVARPGSKKHLVEEGDEQAFKNSMV